MLLWRLLVLGVSLTFCDSWHIIGTHQCNAATYGGTFDPISTLFAVKIHSVVVLGFLCQNLWAVCLGLVIHQQSPPLSFSTTFLNKYSWALEQSFHLSPCCLGNICLSGRQCVNLEMCDRHAGVQDTHNSMFRERMSQSHIEWGGSRKSSVNPSRKRVTRFRCPSCRSREEA